METYWSLDTHYTIPSSTLNTLALAQSDPRFALLCPSPNSSQLETEPVPEQPKGGIDGVTHSG